MKTPSDKKIAFYFVSQEVARTEDRWSARVHFPPGATASTVLPIEVSIVSNLSGGNTVYIGGGTPSQLKAEDIADLAPKDSLIDLIGVSLLLMSSELQVY